MCNNNSNLRYQKINKNIFLVQLKKNLKTSLFKATLITKTYLKGNHSKLYNEITSKSNKHQKSCSQLSTELKKKTRL